MSKQKRTAHLHGHFHINLPDPAEWFSMYPNVEISEDIRNATFHWTIICLKIMSRLENAPKKDSLLRDAQKLQAETADVLYRLLGSGDRREISDVFKQPYAPPTSLPVDSMEAPTFVVDLLKSTLRGLRWYEDEVGQGDFGLSSDDVWDWWIGGITQMFDEAELNTTVRKDDAANSQFALFIHNLQDSRTGVPKIGRHMQSLAALSQGIYRSRERTQKTLFPSVTDILKPDKDGILRLWVGDDGKKAVRFK